MSFERDPLTTTKDLVDLFLTSLVNISDINNKIITTHVITNLDALALAETLTVAASAARGLHQRIPHSEPFKLS